MSEIAHTQTDKKAGLRASMQPMKPQFRNTIGGVFPKEEGRHLEGLVESHSKIGNILGMESTADDMIGCFSQPSLEEKLKHHPDI